MTPSNNHYTVFLRSTKAPGDRMRGRQGPVECSDWPGQETAGPIPECDADLPGSLDPKAAQAAWRFLRTCRTRATAPIIPAHASAVAGSGTGTSWITPPWAE